MTVVGMTVDGARGFMLEVPFHVIHDQQIKQTIIIYIDPDSADGPERPVFRIGFVEPGLCRYIGEGSVSVVVVERIFVHTCDKNIFVSVVVVVADRHADVVTAAGETSFLGDVGEVSFAIILKKTV